MAFTHEEREKIENYLHRNDYDWKDVMRTSNLKYYSIGSDVIGVEGFEFNLCGYIEGKACQLIVKRGSKNLDEWGSESVDALFHNIYEKAEAREKRLMEGEMKNARSELSDIIG
ncbi:hypothetical protein GOV11_05310 [Candidatus Woesearchaeota archaeon]|nr:hypothetical protein [Candidatus Woesearchaeota archaeon]